MRSRRRQELERLHQESAQIIRKARVEAEAIITQSRADAERLREEMRQKARAEADGIVRNAERQIQLETARALQQIRHEAVDLSVMIASKIIQRNLIEGRQRAADRRRAQTGGDAQALTSEIRNSEFAIRNSSGGRVAAAAHA